jgi:DNA-binding CsgD family transcriptional regulator
MIELSNVSHREIQVLKLIAYEYTTKEIATQLYISSHTVESHRKNLMSKLNVRNVAGLVRRGFEVGFLESRYSYEGMTG